MVPIPFSQEMSLASDREIWANLRQAIASSSGFQQWQQEQPEDHNRGLDQWVQLYLRETLATLAY